MKYLLILMCLLCPTLAEAGSRDLYVRVINMTPDPVDDAGRACSASIRQEFGRANEVQRRAQGETATRRAYAANGGDGESDFMTWEAQPFQRMRAEGEEVDAYVLFDCQPSANAFRAAVFPAAGGVAHTEVRRMVRGEGFTRWISARLVAQSWVGFTP